MTVSFAGVEYPVGTPVLARDGTEVGVVLGAQDGKLVVDVHNVERHLLLPSSAVSVAEDEFILLDLTPEWVLRGKWGEDVGVDERDNKQVINIHEEDLVAAKREIALGLLSIKKRIVEDIETLEVPVYTERARVVRTDVDRIIDPGSYSFEDGVIEIELRGETVDVGKQVRVTGQVEVDKERLERTETVTGKTRREEIDVEEVTYDADGNPIVSNS